jgi:hypothetical protein
MQSALNCRHRRIERWAVATAALVCMPLAAKSQTAAFTACTQGVLANCASLQLTSTLGIGPGGTNFFEVAVRNLGSTSTPSLATSIYNLVFSTGQAAAPGSEVDAAVSPVASGGATITDAGAWDVFDSGDAIFLSALNNTGVGGCVRGTVVDGFSQGGQTCPADSFLSFGFFTPRAYDPTAFSLLDLEVVGLTGGLPADSCNESSPCAVSELVTATPEPGSLLLALSGFTWLAVSGFRRRRSSSFTMLCNEGD